MTTADAIIERLKLAPHPEGGYFRETFRDAATDANGRARSTAIHFLLEEGQVSRWHRVDAVEIWHWYAGAPLQLSMADAPQTPVRSHILGPDVLADEAPQIVVPTGIWQRARSLGAWTLVGCTVAPGFSFAGFEMADEGRFPE